MSRAWNISDNNNPTLPAAELKNLFPPGPFQACRCSGGTQWR